MTDTTQSQSVTEAVKQQHEDELGKLEAEVTKQLAEASNEPAPTQEGDKPTETAKEDGTSDSTPATEETKALSENKEPVKEEAKPEADGQKGKVETDTGDEFEDEDVKHLSEKAQKRFRSMNEKLKEANRQIEVLKKFGPKQTVETPTSDKGKVTQGLPWDTTAKADPEQREVTEEEYQAEVERKARQVVQTELRNEKILTTLSNDTREAEAKYQELDPKSDTFDPVLVTNISTWYKALFQQNEEIRFKDFVEEVMSLRAKGVERGKSEVTATVMRQAAEQAMTPSATKVEHKSASEAISKAKTISDLEAAEALVNSSV